MTTADDSRIDPAVVARWYAEHADDLRAFLIGVLRSREAANEALQATFAKALETGHTAKPETLRGWLFRVAYHEALGQRRRSKTDSRVLEKSAWSQSPETASPDELTIRNETAARMRFILAKLPAEQRQVVRLRIYENKTFAEIATETGAPLGTVLTRMRLALQKLREQLGSE